MLISFGISKSLASSDIVILNTNNNKYHKADCEYAKKIYVSMFYLTNYWITNALVEANNRGVEIKIIVDETLKKEPKSQIDELEKAGISIKTENCRGKMHQKSMVVDDFITVIASTN